MGGWTGKSHRPLPRGRRSRNHPDQPEQSKPSDQGVGRGGGAGWPPVVPSQCPTIESARGRGCGAARPLRAPPRGRTCPMDPAPSMAMPSNHTSGGGVLMGRDDAMHQMVVFEDPQCPYCRQFEEACGDVLRSGWEAGTLAVEFRMRCFLGVESVPRTMPWRLLPKPTASTNSVGSSSLPNRERGRVVSRRATFAHSADVPV